LFPPSLLQAVVKTPVPAANNPRNLSVSLLFMLLYFYYPLSFFFSSSIYSAVRIDNAKIVHVRFLSPCCTKGPASTTKRFLQSCACPHLFRTEVLGSLPIRVVPPS